MRHAKIIEPWCCTAIHFPRTGLTAFLLGVIPAQAKGVGRIVNEAVARRALVSRVEVEVGLMTAFFSPLRNDLQ